jgi:zinc transporter
LNPDSGERPGQLRSTLKNADISYGSDSSGLICGYLFTPDLPGLSIDVSGAKDWLEASGGTRAGEFIWLHFSLSNVNSNRWLGENLQLPDEFFETMREGTGATHIEQADDCLIAVINDVVYEFAYEPSQTATLWMCVGRNFVVTVRLHPLRSVDRLQRSVRAGDQIASPVFLLAHLLRDQADVLQQISRHATKQIDQIEDRLLTGATDVRRITLGALRRLFVHLRRLLAPEPGALFRLLNRPPAWLDEDDVQELRAATEEATVVLGDLSTLQERTKLLQEEMSALTNERTNRSLYLLTTVTVLALPINIVAGMLGMNVGGVPLAENHYGFWIMAAIIATFTSIVGWRVFVRMKDW